jgi:hypothetical protein
MQTKNSKRNDSEYEPSNERFVVLRNGARVSDEEYSNREDAQPEYDHWNRIVTRWPDGSKLEIVNLNNKRNNR